MTPTDNLEAGAGDLVAELNRIADMAAETIDTGGREEFDPRGVEDVLLEAAAQLAAVTAENARLRDLTDKWEAECGVWHTEAQNQLFRAETAEAQLKAAREALAEALHFITNIDNAHKSVRMIRAVLSQEAPK